ncbi:hypothetical protein QBC46DRAFT_383509 [Diplogelasinospora grovesii]|uniref:Nucleoporin Pom152 n=1 Tax=Diplogelasinospora grovesii TaxID=303347 RepID=A0AAN6N8P6_9PEZI|nr:hypothetical protein QBC46DRAFT_383509 [Diplogelasinospora grovesii]
MEGAPSIGAFPQTPAVSRRRQAPMSPPTSDRKQRSAATSSTNNSRLPVAPQPSGATTTPNSTPVIPTTILDAPTQRLYALAIYFFLFAWKLYDWAKLVEDNTESFWLFLKWIAIDLVFLFGLPELRIPWLELSQPFVVVLFFFHALLDWMFMFNIGLPWQAWLLGFVKVFYDREVAISEHNVKLSSILHNSSLIMGRQIINILPEGSAVLNPDHVPFCLGGDNKVAQIPMYFNATIPIEVELIRVDLDTNAQEVMKLSRGQLRDIERQAKKHTPEGGESVVQYSYPVKKAGAYRLGKVLDEYKLEVQRKSGFTFVVPCPRAWVGSTPSSERCIGDLTDLSLQVEGTPPLKIVYSQTINGKERGFHFQSLQPDGFSSPLSGSFHSTALTGPEDDEDISWARSQRIPVNLNESMHTSGEWQYSVDEVHDAFGNVVKYASPVDDPEGKPKPKHLVQKFVVKERPRVRLEGCDLKTPLKVAKGESKELPIRFEISGPTRDDTSHSLTWQFSPIDTLTESGDHGDVVLAGEHHARNAHDRPRISAPGLYTLKSVTAGSCEGEVQEPSSCLLLNPLEPKLTIRSEEIPDICAGNTIGLRVDLDLVGTPPFVIRYDEITNGYREPKKIVVYTLRHQMELIPKLAGIHQYIFTHIGDDVYRERKLTGPEYVLEQDVRPAATAIIQHSEGKTSACLGEEVDVPVLLLGDPPFTLEWETIYDGKRKYQKATDIQKSTYKIKTAPLTQGGEYTLALTSVQDKRNCRNFLRDEIKINVRRQSPRVAFGQIENRRKTMAVEGSTVKLPIRLTGEGPWKVSYVNLDDPSKVMEKTVRHDNDFLDVKSRGVFQIKDIWDNQCHGVVDSKASTFEVDWVPRPKLRMMVTPGVHESDGHYVLDPVCEGDVSGFEIDLKGTPPYHVEYEVRHQPGKGKGSLSRKAFDTAVSKAPIQMETTKAGLYTYTFNSLADNQYTNNRDFEPIVVQQKVNQKPTASFVKPGQTFKYCMSEQRNEESIPITLSGVAPFSLEFEIKHQSGAGTEIYRTPAINSHTYDIKIPRERLRLGIQQVRIRSVKDGSGCQSTTTEIGGPSVQVHLFDAPSIYPLETRTDYCVGDRISYTLSGTPPFEVWYTFDGVERKAKSPTTAFRRIAESPGEFVIKTVSDKGSECRAPVEIAKTIHPLPAVKISKGKNVRVDIHEGGEVEILFEFWGTPPFEFTYTRSSNARKGQKSQVLETRHDVSYEHSKVVRASQEGTYEVVAIKDKYCAFSTNGLDGEKNKESSQKLLKYT